MKNKIFNLIKNPLFKRMAVYAFSDGISRAMPFLVFPIVAYYLSTEDYGRVSNFNVMAQVLSAFIGMSTQTFLSVEYYRIEPSARGHLVSNLTYLNLILAIIAFVLLSVFSKPVEAWTGLSFVWQMLAVSIVFLSANSNLFSTKLRLDENVKLYTIYKFGKSLISALLTLLFVVVLLWSWQGRIFGLFLSAILGGAFALYYLFKQKLYFYKINTKAIWRYLAFGLPLVPHNLATWIRRGFDKLFITQNISLAANGVYSFASTISIIFTMFSMAFFNAYTPHLLKKLTEIEKNPTLKNAIQRKLIKQSYAFIGIYSLVLLLGYFGSIILINLFFKEKYQESITYLPFFLGANLFTTIYSIFSAYIFYSKKTKYFGLLLFSTSFIQVILTVLLVPNLGPVGAGWSMLISTCLIAIATGLYSNRVYSMPWLSIFAINQEK